MLAFHPVWGEILNKLLMIYFHTQHVAPSMFSVIIHYGSSESTFFVEPLAPLYIVLVPQKWGKL